ncbi:cyclopropane-fatty-acyl-phospholipid synthase family protein [Arthrobacter sp. AL08]|uniref:SAM-dependent methyltransferase n=1 Tax=unclassified Arthrobacter TaxID=235627 RepID=UPI002499B47A|nr:MULTISPECIES: cyclopropane-fatty-acyl-phospholipid synthase family protein [unclassified Arthrobacter]MDI3242344.1 cyclopropane-fatty-acyl-phospholipid synthase family protein [Arthrobacter sp. AL05]MDI3278354.1 cyclopropane-fatty-acyl-phospholipid synthase family protein [Arthrobacter sp. AL08]
MTAPLATMVEEVLRPLAGGELPVRLVAWDGSEAGPAGAPVVRLNSPDAIRRLLWAPGELGAAQAYVTGELDLDDDLNSTLEHLWKVVRDRGLAGIRPTPAVLAGVARIARAAGALGAPPPPPASQARVKGRLHSLLRDRAAISHHYDLSNDFYALILDPQMAYSSGYWTDRAADGSSSPNYGLEDAQRDKLDLVCRKIGLKAGMRMLDVGCGWGSLSLHAAQYYGVDVVGVTLSVQQKAFIDARIKERGLEGRVEIRVQDYREIPDGPFDAVASLEMGEHVGQQNYPVYAAALFNNLAPGGRVLVQQMSRRGKHPGGGPFIESFIAPDMHMRPVGDTLGFLEDAGLEVEGVQGMRRDYVRTLEAWYARFEENHAAAVEMMGAEVARVWRLYLVGALRSFAERRMGVEQILCSRPETGR